MAHAQGLEAGQVRSLRDTAIDLAQVVADRGQALTNEELTQAFDKLKIPASSRSALVGLWRRLEGQRS